MTHCFLLLALTTSSAETIQTYRKVECSGCRGKWRVGELWGTGHVLAPHLSQEHTFDLAATIADPEVRALLLVEVVDHNLVFDVVHEHGTGLGPPGDGIPRRAKVRRRDLQVESIERVERYRVGIRRFDCCCVCCV